MTYKAEKQHLLCIYNILCFQNERLKIQYYGMWQWNSSKMYREERKQKQIIELQNYNTNRMKILNALE